MLPTTYRKIVVEKLSTNFKEAIQLIEAPLPVAGNGQLLVRNLYAGMNASVAMLTGGFYPDTPPVPFDLMTESAGEVVAVGPDITTFKIGDHVVVPTGAGFGEYQLISTRQAFPVTQATPEVTAFLISGLTASIALEQVGEMKSDEVVLVTAAAGGTGQFAVQLAKLAGNHVIGTCSSDQKVAMLRELGCDRVINYRTESLHEVLKTEYPRGVNLVYESVGRETFDTCLNHLARFGRLLVIGYVSEYGTGFENVNKPRVYGKLVFKSASLRGFFLPYYYKYFEKHLATLSTLHTQGQLKVSVAPQQFKGLDTVGQAYDYLQSGDSSGKVIISY
jgi:NADPH-dependent curcumin reductase CurA